MSGVNVVLAGEPEAGKALSDALEERGIESRFLSAHTLPDALVGMEEVLELSRPHAAVTVGHDRAALALAITAGKLGVPLAVVGGAEPRDGHDEDRILITLAAFDAGSDPARAAGLIASWLHENPPASDLDLDE